MSDSANIVLQFDHGPLDVDRGNPPSLLCYLGRRECLSHSHDWTIVNPSRSVCELANVLANSTTVADDRRR